MMTLAHDLIVMGRCLCPKTQGGCRARAGCVWWPVFSKLLMDKPLHGQDSHGKERRSHEHKTEIDGPAP